MRDSKLVEMLGMFSKGEMKSFEKFVISPYFTAGRSVEGLFNILKKYHPEFDSANIEREKIFKKLFPREKYNEKKLKNITSSLIKLAEQFMVIDDLKKNPYEFELKLFDHYWKNENLKLFYSTLKSLEKKVDDLPFDHINAYYYKEKILGNKTGYFLKINRPDKGIPLIAETAEYNTLTFLVKFIKANNYKSRIPGTFKAGMDDVLIDTVWKNMDLDTIMADLREKKYSHLWLLELYYNVSRFSHDINDVDSFHKAREIYGKNKEKFSRSEKHFILGDFTAFCIRKFVSGSTDFFRIEFDIAKEFKDENVLIPDDSTALQLLQYRNIVLCAIKVKEYKWLEEFIRDCTPLLRPPYRESMKYFATAKLEFERGNYEKCLENASKVQYDMFTYKLDIKILLLMTYFELALFDQAESMMDTYRHYLKNNKEFSAKYLRKFNDFINIYSALFKAGSTGNPEDHGYLLKKVEDIKDLPARRWLIEKIKGLQK